jgi:hypothetical protein
MRARRLGVGLGLALAALSGMPSALAQIAAESETRDALHRFVDDNMILAFGIVGLLGFTAGALLTHLRNK